MVVYLQRGGASLLIYHALLQDLVLGPELWRHGSTDTDVGLLQHTNVQKFTQTSSKDQNGQFDSTGLQRQSKAT